MSLSLSALSNKATSSMRPFHNRSPSRGVKILERAPMVEKYNESSHILFQFSADANRRKIFPCCFSRHSGINNASCRNPASSKRSPLFHNLRRLARIESCPKTLVRNENMTIASEISCNPLATYNSPFDTEYLRQQREDGSARGK